MNSKLYYNKELYFTTSKDGYYDNEEYGYRFIVHTEDSEHKPCCFCFHLERVGKRWKATELKTGYLLELPNWQCKTRKALVENLECVLSKPDFVDWLIEMINDIMKKYRKNVFE